MAQFSKTVCSSFFSLWGLQALPGQAGSQPSPVKLPSVALPFFMVLIADHCIHEDTNFTLAGLCIATQVSGICAPGFCVCAGVHVCVCAQVNVCVCACGGQRLTSAAVWLVLKTGS